MYQALYRKWRPKTFSDVIGQAHITETLQKQVADGRTSHAYLFTGTRGTGKTTCAKILAKAVNCENPHGGDPCNECASCRGIENGSFLDVLELDAASNNGVDQVRALRDEAIYSPAQVKFRVYIIDEVHMLSTPAFNALLKILEEPPPHLLFILATTELHKVPATILSRCQRFSFKRITPTDIAGRLTYVAAQEKLPLTAEGAELLSRLADGALRDALSLLDQCAAADRPIDSNAVLETLGLAGNLQTAQLMDCVLRRDAKAAILLLGQLYAGGKDVGAVLGELATLTRDLLLQKIAPEGGAALLSGGFDSRTMENLGKQVTDRRLLYLASTLQEMNAALGRSANRRTDAELCLLRLCDESLSGDLTALATRVSRLEDTVLSIACRPGTIDPAADLGQTIPPVSEKPAVQAPVPVAEPAPPAPSPEPPGDRPPWDEPAPPMDDRGDQPPLPEEPPERPGAALPPTVPAVSKAPEKAGSSALWTQLAESCKGQLPPMNRVYLDKASGTLEGDLLTILCEDELVRSRLDTEKVTAILQAAVEQHAGRPIALRFVIGTPTAPSPAARRQQLIDFGSQFDSFQVK